MDGAAERCSERGFRRHNMSQSALRDHNRRQFIKGCILGGCALSLGIPIPRLLAGSRLTDARFFHPGEGKTVRCGLCFRKCFIESGDRGHCRIRINDGGKLKTLAYGNPGAIHLDPIEKKPLFHVRPGSQAYSIAVPGCNLNCKFCQNWQIAQADPDEIRTEAMTPEAIARSAVSSGARFIAYTYSEPVVWSEYVLDCAEAGRKIGIDSVVISNGTWSREVLDELIPRVRAIKVDLKSIEPSYYRDVCEGELGPVLENLIEIRKKGCWLEIVNLVVTTLNDSPANFKKLAEWIKKELGTDVPLHFTRFHPMYRLKDLPPTPLGVLDLAWKTARETGLNYVYVGNVPDHPAQHTECPSCHTRLIERIGFQVKSYSIRDGACRACGTRIPGVWS